MSQPALHVYVALAIASALAGASVLATPLTLARTYLRRVYPTSVAAMFMLFLFLTFLFFPALPSTLHRWNFSREAVWRGGACRRELDTEPSGVVGGCGKLSGLYSGCSPPRWRSTWFWWFFVTFLFLLPSGMEPILI